MSAEKFAGRGGAMTMILTGALAALAFSAATAHADLDAPTPIGDEFNVNDFIGLGPWLDTQELYNRDFSVPNAPDETFEGVVRLDQVAVGAYNYNLFVEQDISGNVPIGEQYNDLSLGLSLSGWGEVYSTIGGTPEAFIVTPFGDLNFPTWFVEAVGPSFFEPASLTEAPVSAATLSAELPGLAADLASPLAGLW
jgi:hypothetical protein